MRRKLCLAVATAAVLWFLMFSPWTRDLVNFWIGMTFSALVLLGMGLAFTPDREQVLKVEKPMMHGGYSGSGTRSQHGCSISPGPRSRTSIP